MNYHVTYLYNGKVCLQGNMTAALALALADHIADNLGSNAARIEYKRERDAFHDWITLNPVSGSEHYLLARAADDAAYMMKVQRI